MVRDLPKHLQRAMWCQIIGMILLGLSLLVGRALPFILTIGGGCLFLALAVIFFLLFYMKSVKDPESAATNDEAEEAA